MTYDKTCAEEPHLNFHNNGVVVRLSFNFQLIDSLETEAVHMPFT